ncbi:MAG: hypothetical protein ACKVX7_09040 [Planctomycetota bacterium]
MSFRARFVAVICALSVAPTFIQADTLDIVSRSIAAEACGALLPTDLCDSPADVDSLLPGLFNEMLAAVSSSDGDATGTASQSTSVSLGNYSGSLAVAATADSTVAAGFQITEGFANSQLNVTFTLDQPTTLALTVSGAVVEGAPFTSGRAQIVITATPLGATAYQWIQTVTGTFDESASVMLAPGTYLLFVEVNAQAQAQGTGPLQTTADILFEVSDGSVVGGGGFRRGDVNADGGFDVGDPVFLLSSLFVSGSPAPACTDAADINDDGGVDIGDAVFALNALFVVGSPLPPAPGATNCGLDPTADSLACADPAPCT